jgi:anti-anti-sigma factor
MSQSHEVFHVDRVDATLVVVPQGPALNFRYPDVHRESNELFRMMDGPDLSNVVIDLSAVDYVDSVIIGSIIRLLQKARVRRGRAVFCSASESMQEILKSIKVGTIWPLYATREEALEAIRSGTA